MATAAKVITTLVSASEALLGNEKISGKLLGKYSDGSVRSIPDAFTGEIISPKDRDPKKNKKKKKKHKKKLKLY